MFGLLSNVGIFTSMLSAPMNLIMARSH